MEIKPEIVAGFELEDPLPFNHRFQKLLHAVVSIEKAHRVLGFVPAFDFETRHRATHAWFLTAGLDRLATTFNDPIWNIARDFQRDGQLLEKLRGTSGCA
jgi:hypothetical protein